VSGDGVVNVGADPRDWFWIGAIPGL